MPPTPPSDRELDAYREEADRFLAELDEEFYLHYAGHKETLDLAPIYERHAGLTELEQVQAIGLAVNGGSRVRELWRFACEGYFGELTRDHDERLAELEAELEIEHDGERIPFRMVRPTLANEPDRNKRRELDRVQHGVVANSADVMSDESTKEDRAHALLDTAELAERSGRLKEEIRQLERDKVRYQRDLDDYLARRPQAM